MKAALGLRSMVIVFFIIIITLVDTNCSEKNQNVPQNASSTDSSRNLSDSMYLPDSNSTANPGGRGMMGNGMMNGGMMGRGMMNNGTMGKMMMNGNSSGKSSSGNWKAPASADKLKNPLAGIEEAAMQGEEIFKRNCVTCHGTEGKGNGPTAAMLNPKPADLASAKVQSQSDGAIFWKITNGNTPMPSFKNVLSEKQRWEVVDYIKTLSNKK